MRPIAATALAAALALPAAAADYELYPSSKASQDGTYRGVLEVLRGGRRVAEYRVDRGEIEDRTIRDPYAAIALVVARLNLSPARDRVTYCDQGSAFGGCFQPEEEGPGPWIVFWP